MYTDDPVTINGKGVKIVGQGCEIDLINKKMWIKKDAEMEMDGIKNDLFFLSKDNASQNDAQTSPEDAIHSGETGHERNASRKDLHPVKRATYI